MARLQRLRRSPLVISVVVVGAVATLLVATAVRSRSLAHAEEWLADRAEVVQAAMRETVDDLVDGVQAVAAFMETADGVTQQAFTAFVGKLDPRISLIGIAYVPVVPASEVDEFVREMQATVPDFAINDIDLSGEVLPVTRQRDTYYPVQYFAPGEFLNSAVSPEDGTPLSLAVGIDAGANPQWEDSLLRALQGDDPIVSDFIPISFEEVVIGQAFLITVSVHDDRGRGDRIATVAAPMIDVLLPTELDVSIARDVVWEIGQPGTVLTEMAPSEGWTGVIELPGTTWQLRVLPTAERGSELHGVPTWLVWAIGLGLTGLAAGFAHLVRQRTRSRARLTQLQRMSEDKDRFLAAVSHELRTPLTAVSGLAHELRDRPDDFGPEEVSSLLEMVAEQSDEVAAIVEDLLVAARSDIGKVSVHAEVMDVRKETEHALGTSGVRAVVVGAAPTAAWADPQRVRQILRNLLTNALRYGGPDIEVRFDGADGWVAVTVADNGNPIPDVQQERIFDPYTSAHHNGEELGSIGLGLFISRKLSVLMGGELSYHHDGSWSLFRLQLPTVSPDGNGPVARQQADLASTAGG